MSNATSDNAGAGRQRRRSRGGRNRNRSRDGQQGQRGDNSGRSREGGASSRGRRRSGGRRPEPVKLTWWQKLLKAIGLYKEPARPARSEGRPKDSPAKSNTRVAKAPAGKRERPPREKPPVADAESNRLYLGNLSYEATESDLEELFKGVGTVRRVEIVYNRKTHRSKGYGFVDMLGVDEAQRAVEVLHDQFFMGRKLVVSGAKSQGPAEDSTEDSADDAADDAAEAGGDDKETAS